jgi:hypothetical protein
MHSLQLSQSRSLSYLGEMGPIRSMVHTTRTDMQRAHTVNGSHVLLLTNDGTHCFTTQSVTVKCSSERLLRVTGVWTMYRNRVKQYFQPNEII